MKVGILKHPLLVHLSDLSVECRVLVFTACIQCLELGLDPYR